MFTHDELAELQSEVFKDCTEILKAKNADYSRGEEALQAFKESAAKLDISPEKMLGGYMNKHFRAMWAYITDPERELASESFDSRIKDIINYLVLLLAMKRERELLRDTEKQDNEKNKD